MSNSQNVVVDGGAGPSLTVRFIQQFAEDGRQYLKIQQFAEDGRQ